MTRLSCDQIAAYVLQMQTLRSELPDVEAKDGRRGLPQRIYETLSALANRRRYHGMAPLVSLLVDHGDIEARAVHQRTAFDAGVQFARIEGILPAPESNHAIRVAIDEAIAAREAGQQKVILFNLSGHGHFDLAAYDAYHRSTLEDYELSDESIAASVAGLPKVHEFAG